MADSVYNNYLDTLVATTPKTDTKNPAATPPKETQDWGSVATAASSIFSTGVNLFSTKVRTSNQAVAEAKAREAEANAARSGDSNGDSKFIMIGLAVIVLVIILAFTFKKK